MKDGIIFNVRLISISNYLQVSETQFLSVFLSICLSQHHIPGVGSSNTPSCKKFGILFCF